MSGAEVSGAEVSGRKERFYKASSRVCLRLVDARESGDPRAIEAALTASQRVWERSKLEPGGLPPLLPGEAFRVLRDLGLTLVWPTGQHPATNGGGDGLGAGTSAGAGTGSRHVGMVSDPRCGRAVATAPGLEPGSGAKPAQPIEMGDLVAAAGLPPELATSLALAAAELNLTALELSRDPSRLDAFARAAQLRVGQRLKLANTLRRAYAPVV